MKQQPGNPKSKIENPKLIRASEIGEYGYCSRAWWYRYVARVEPPGTEYSGRLARGKRAHARHGRLVAASSAMRAVGVLAALCGLLVLIAALLMAVIR